jgi:alkyl hydroperoxide reductase subunit AhpC
MNRIVSFVLILSTTLTLSLLAQDFERYSKNPIPKLNVIGIALSQDAATAKGVIDDFYTKQMRLKLEFPIFVDATYKKLGEQKAFDISLFGKSVTGKKYFTLSDSLLELNATPYTLLIIDRNKRIRAFSQAMMIDPENVSKVVEELLLNLDGKENITEDSGEPTMAEGWQTDLGKQNAKKEKKGFTISLGPKKELWYSQLGNQAPDFEVQTLDGSKTTLHKVLEGKVSALFFWLAPSDPDIGLVGAGTGVMTQFVNSLYHAFGLGEAAPGDEDVKNATPEPDQSKK